MNSLAPPLPQVMETLDETNTVPEQQPPPRQRHGPGRGQGHHRLSSDPLRNSGAITPNTVEGDRRSLFERGWSTSNVNQENRTVTRGVGGSSSRSMSQQPDDDEEQNEDDQQGEVLRLGRSPAFPRLSLSPADLAHFHQSWTTTDGEDLFGAPMPFAPSASTSFLDVTRCVDRPEVSHARMLSSPRINSAGISSAIHDAARITNWDEVLRLCETHPEYATYSGRDRWTALHHACNRRCPFPNVVEALIRAYPDALLQEEEKGWLPLHYACRFKAPKEVVRLLLYMYPEKGKKAVSRVDRVRRTPLFYAVRYEAPPGVVGLLLEVDPAAVLEEDQNSESPLALVWDSWVEKLEGKRIVNSFIPGGFPEREEYSPEERALVLQNRLKREPKLYKRWLQVNMLLKAAFGFPVDDALKDTKSPSAQSSKQSDPQERQWRIVHATAAVKVHPTLFLLACALYPQQVRELDSADLFPKRVPIPGQIPHQTALHLAASSNAGGEPGKTVLLELLREYREAAEMPDGYDGSLPLHRMVENENKQDWTNHAAILYRFYTRAVQIPDSNGKLPLHRAAKAIKHDNNDDDEDGEESIVLQLVRLFPQASTHADNQGCLPLHLIASHAEVWDNAVESVYNVNRIAVSTRAGADQCNRLPIHMAAASTRSQESLISKLVHLNPRGVTLVDRQGKLPLHLACEIGKNWDAGVRAIHSAFPDAVNQGENNPRGWLALHMAANAPSFNVELIEKLVELNPAAAGIADQNGRYPLHLACQSGKTWLSGLELLFDASPSVMATPDTQGMFPFHIAALRYCKTGEEDSGEITPFKIDERVEACHAAELDILFNILKADPTIVSSFHDAGNENA